MATVIANCENGCKEKKTAKRLADYAYFFLRTDNNAGDILPSGDSSDISFTDHSFMHLKDDLDDIFASHSRKTIVIIDDIDRLSNAEILQVFQIVKVMADFPNTIYIASMDKNVVIKALEKIRESSGVEYLEKMVQVPFEIPLISKEEVESALLSRIKELLSQATDNKLDEIYWGNIYHGGLKKFFRGIRDVTRYVNNLKFGFDMVKSEVNLVDFLAVTALQVFAPEVYFGIRDNKNLFTGIFDTESPSAKTGKESISDIISRSRNVDPNLLQELLKRMFPKLETIFEEIGYDEEWLARWRREGRICSREMFDIYFRLSLGEGTISRRRVQQVFSLAGDQAAFAGAIIEINDEGNLGSFMTLFENYAREFPEKHIPNVVSTLMDLGDLFPDEDPGLAVVNTSMRVLHMVYELLHRLDSKEARFECFVNTINNAI
jgi:predicted KAP-like P-loop ATPase